MERVETLRGTGTETAERRRIPSSANTGDVLDHLKVFVVHIYLFSSTFMDLYLCIHSFIYFLSKNVPSMSLWQ